MRAGSYSENTLRAAGKNRRDGPRCFSPVHSHFVKHCNHHGVLLRTKKSSQLFQPVLTPAGIYPCCCLRSDRECVSKLPVTMDWQVEKVCVCVCDTLPVSRLIGRRVSRRSATKLSLQLTCWLMSVAAEFDWKPSRFSLLTFCNHADRKCNSRIMFGINTCSFIFH